MSSLSLKLITTGILGKAWNNIEQSYDVFSCSTPPNSVITSYSIHYTKLYDCSILYRASAEQFLDMECLAMTGTLLSGRMIRA